ncbi:hypothetical protein WA158_001002 [Blastocystis sp. Blastoise]
MFENHKQEDDFCSKLRVKTGDLKIPFHSKFQSIYTPLKKYYEFTIPSFGKNQNMDCIMDCFELLITDLVEYDDAIPQARELCLKSKQKVHKLKRENSDMQNTIDTLTQNCSRLNDDINYFKNELDQAHNTILQMRKELERKEMTFKHDLEEARKNAMIPCASCNTMIKQGVCSKCFDKYKQACDFDNSHWYCENCSIWNPNENIKCSKCHFTEKPDKKDFNAKPNNQLDDSDDKHKCQVCFLSDCDCCLLPCKHMNHRECLQDDTCPICASHYTDIIDIIYG